MKKGEKEKRIKALKEEKARLNDRLSFIEAELDDLEVN